MSDLEVGRPGQRSVSCCQRRTSRKATKTRNINCSDIVDCLKHQLRDGKGLEGCTAVRARSKAVDIPILKSSLDGASKYSLGECRKNSGREYDPVYIQIRSIISVTEKDGGNRGKGNK